MNAASPLPVLSTDHLVKRFGGILATDHVSLRLHQDARHALIGPNGAGKTTLINLLTGMLMPSRGQVLLGGEDITALPSHLRVRRGLVRTFQINQLFHSMTPLQTLTLAATRRGRGWRQALQAFGRDAAAVERAGHLLEQFRLGSVAHVETGRLAYGKRRLLEMAIALACEPRVLLLDEPAAGVPAGEREELLQTVMDLPADVSILLIEHDMDLVFRFASWMTVLVNGKVLAQGEPQQIAGDPRVRAVYLGSTETGPHAGREVVHG